MTISILPEKHSITQFDLVRFASLTAQIDSLKSEHADLEQELTNALDSGVAVEPGAHTAQLKTTEGRNVSWKTVVIRLKGTGYASRILSCTKPTTYTKLVVR